MANATARGAGGCGLVGRRGHAPPLESFNPLFQMPFCGVHCSAFASAFTYGAPDYPRTDVPLQEIVDRVAAGRYKAKPARVFGFDEVPAALDYLSQGLHMGKVVVQVS